MGYHGFLPSATVDWATRAVTLSKTPNPRSREPRTMSLCGVRSMVPLESFRIASSWYLWKWLLGIMSTLDLFGGSLGPFWRTNNQTSSRPNIMIGLWHPSWAVLKSSWVLLMCRKAMEASRFGSYSSSMMFECSGGLSWIQQLTLCYSACDSGAGIKPTSIPTMPSAARGRLPNLSMYLIKTWGP